MPIEQEFLSLFIMDEELHNRSLCELAKKGLGNEHDDICSGCQEIAVQPGEVSGCRQTHTLQWKVAGQHFAIASKLANQAWQLPLVPSLVGLEDPYSWPSSASKS